MLTQDSIVVENFSDRQARFFDIEVQIEAVNVQVYSSRLLLRRHFALHICRDTLCGGDKKFTEIIRPTI